VERARARKAPKAVCIGLSKLDVDNGANMRVATEVKGKGKGGADIEISTWYETRLWSIGADVLMLL
jgi:hypothetical protein